jgi:hypothetical protein
MAIDKLIPQYLNSDTDQKLVKSVEMTDNLNVRVSNDGEGTAGVIKNIKGTDVVGAKTSSDTFPSGNNRVIGAVDNEHNKEIIFLLWNNLLNHGIYRMDTTTGKYQKIYQDSVLNFKKLSYADCSVIINDKGETLFYWTDDINPPMKININWVILNQYPSSLFSGNDEEKLLNLTVAKRPPLRAPDYVIKNNPSLKGVSRIKNDNYQFAYKYVYQDGEHSALSPYSSLSIANSQLVDGFNTNPAKDFFNQIDISVLNTVADAKKIIVYARRVNGRFFEIADLENSFNTNVSKVEFTDDVLGTFLPEEEKNKIYDNVPQTARAQAIVSNRLMYGSYREGYENVDTDVDLIDNYKKAPSSQDLNVSIRALDTGYSNGVQRLIDIDYSNITVPAVDSKLMLNFFVDFKDVLVAGTSTQGEHIVLPPNSLEIEYKVKNDDTQTKFATFSPSYIYGRGLVAQFLQDIWSVIISGSPNFDPALTFSTEGVQVKQIIEIPANSSLAAIRALVETSLESQKFRLLLNPSNGDRRFSRLRETASPGTLFQVESASFKGRMNVEIKKFSSSNTSDVYTISGKTAEISLHEFTDSSGREGTIVSSNKVRLNPSNSRFFFVEAELHEGTNAMYNSILGERSFKSGASHELGMVYYDDRGRTSGVQELGSVFFNHLNNRFSENSLYGACSSVLRIKHAPPVWAKRWSPVYTGRANKELAFQYGVKGAFLPSNNFNKTTVLSSDDNIYVSLNSLFNKEGSYTKSSSALIDYKFENGDKLRIVQYGDKLRTQEEFEVVDFVTLTDDETKNPILEKVTEAAKEATTGDFLVIKNNADATLFNYSSILDNTSKWFKNCIVEVYRDRKEIEEDVYYEIGKSYPVTSQSHSDERTSLSVPVTVVNNSVTDGEISTTTKIFKGDKLILGALVVNIGNVYESDGIYKAHTTSTGVPTNGTYTVQNPDSVIDLSIGDVYFRARSCVVASEEIDSLTFSNASSRNTILAFIEDYSVSDFFPSKHSSVGRPFAYIPEASTKHRTASITYSDAYLIDSERLGLSSFNLSTANWKDLGLSDGSIQSLIDRNEAITVIQQSKASNVSVNRNLIEYTSGKSNLTVSKSVLGNASYYAGDYGTNNPESVVERFGVVYFVDVEAAKVIRLSADGITPISEKGMNSFFEDKFKNLLKVTDRVIVIGAFDPDNGEYIITVEPVYNSSLTTSGDVSNVPVDTDGEFTVNGMTFTSQTVLWNTFGNLWEIYCGNWEDVGNGVVFVDSSFQALGVLIDSSYYNSTGTIKILVTDTAYSFSAIATIDLSTGIITLPSTDCSGNNIVLGSAVEKEQGFTISYKHKEGVWGSKYSFKPSMYVSINNELYSFSDTSGGLMWKHNSSDTRNNFYGTQYNSEIEVVSNRNPSMVKVFEAIGIEGGGSWSGVLKTSNQNTTIGTSDFEEREGHNYSMIYRDSQASTGHQIYIGKVESVNSDKVTFTTPVNRLPFVVGDILKTASGSSLNGTGMEISGITDRKTVQCTANISNISVGDNVFVEHSSRIDGDPMRDVFLKIKLTSSDTTAFEVHALSLSYDRSRLHNDRVN